ncbi:MAG: large conductance mechanosensitive channel protein MscL [Clostridia bacterium]|nr:large conductance mechanosensitive channel protein MscL [Clostridia bacterium]
MQKFFGEFRKFITRGNVVDMAVGVIVGASFTAIVNALSNNILKPLVNFLLAKLFKADSLSELYTMLKPVYVKDEITGKDVLDLTQSIYIDWGAFINAVISFFLIAFVLFTIVKVINRVREEHREFVDELRKKHLSRAEVLELRAAGIRVRDRAAVKAYFEEKARRAEEEKRAAEEKARAEAENVLTVEKLLTQIRDLMAAQQK